MGGRNVRIACAAGLVAAALGLARPSRAEGPCGRVDRANVVSCAIAASPRVRAEARGVDAAEGHVASTAPWFPSPAVANLSLARRVGTDGRADALNFYASLSQEIELSGRRRSARREAEAERDARKEDATQRARLVAADAYGAYFSALAARDAAEIARRVDAIGRTIAKVTRARAEAGVGSELDAEIAEAAALRLTQAVVAADRERDEARARLSVLVTGDPRVPVTLAGELEPIAVARGEIAPAEGRPEVRALEHEGRAMTMRAEAFRRARVPNPSVQLFAQNDGYNEPVLGAGVAFPVPLPQPIGRLYNGEIAEAEALADRSSELARHVARDVREELAVAEAHLSTRAREAALYDAARAERAERLLGELGKEIEAGRVSVRDALVAEREIVDVLRGRVEARRALCAASVRYALAAGVALERGGR